MPSAQLTLTAYGSTLDRPWRFGSRRPGWTCWARCGVAIQRTVTAGTGRSALSRGPAAAGRERDRLESDSTHAGYLVSGKRSGSLSASAGAPDPGSSGNAMKLRWVVLAVILLLGGGKRRGISQERQPFDHWQHRKLFPGLRQLSCRSAGADRSLWPAAAACADCHDGTVEKRVDGSRLPAFPGPTCGSPMPVMPRRCEGSAKDSTVSRVVPCRTRRTNAGPVG